MTYVDINGKFVATLSTMPVIVLFSSILVTTNTLEISVHFSMMTIITIIILQSI
jgi:hypothetical protein